MRKRVGIWLAACALLVFAMIVVGGVTRLTRSGLSITTWDPVTGVLPPIGAEAWHEAFGRYQASPEGLRVNVHMTLEEFRGIYYVEWAHRLLGRITGFVVAVPLVVFLLRRELTLRRALPVIALLALGAAQATLGWYMVKSGLVSEPRVSPFRLAAHLLVGMTLLGWLVWSSYGELVSSREDLGAPSRRAATVALAATALAIGYGALMAGNHAGLLCSTFPTMNGEWLPAQVRLASPSAWLDDAWTIHFVHRALAFVVLSSVLTTVRLVWTGPPRVRALAGLLLFVVASQITLGAWVVLRHVPLPLAALHQANAAALVVILVALLREASPSITSDISQRHRAPTTQESGTGWVSRSSKAPMRAFHRTIRSSPRSSARQTRPRPF